MIDISGIKIRELFIHRVGNLLRNEGTVLAETGQKLSIGDLAPLIKFLFGHSDRLNSFEFTHSVNVELNAVAVVAAASTNKSLSLKDASQQIATHLYSVSDHPRVKPGNLFVGIFEGIVFQKKPRTALGIFKSDAMSPFIKVEVAKGKTTLNVDQGAAISSLDKVALVFLPEKGGPFPVLAACARGEDAVFWNERFLQVAPINSAKSKTKAYLDACREFAVKEDSQFSSTGRALFLNRSLQFFEEAEKFDGKAFANVFSNSAQEREFNRFMEVRDFGLKTGQNEAFSIERAVVRKQRVKFERNIRLDSNIEIRLRFSDQSEMAERVEHGFDEVKRLPFCKLYYSKE